MRALSTGEGIPTGDMKWSSWKPEVIKEIPTLAKGDKRGSDGKWIKAKKGGKVGGKRTCDNKVTIPKNALAEDTCITVDVLCVDGREQCGAGVDFGPKKLTFRKEVRVTLSWAYLDYEEGAAGNFQTLDFQVYYSEDDGGTWYEVEGAEVDYDKKTVSVYIDHFTRFAWAL